MAEAARSWWARAILIGTVVAVVLLLLGPIGTRLGIWGFQTGLLMLIPAGTLLAAVGLLVGLVALFVSRKRGFTGDGPILLTSVLVCALVVGLMFLQASRGFSLPQIHNISTDVNDPPQFDAIVALRGEGTNPLDYDREKLASVQQQAYPAVKTLRLETDRATAVGRVVDALTAMGLEIVAVDADAGIIEATATTFWFGFKDDVVVRVRDDSAGGVKVDARSVSRVGLSDLGANAARIEALLGRLRTG
ncbi:MAG: DUF1499 domain-containing protein [Pseudomonadales bacterium]